ncbi:MAG: BlaI/MecI/CopY family transcriptional regulator [Blastocatellia bacterium]|nr:BlaI/MecI/CopY family transcriptional regulator [Blastocatellia bacterium]
MTAKAHDNLSRRERQIMDIIHRLGKATATEVMDALPNPPSYSTVRALLRLMEEKGYLRHETDGTKYVYLPTLAREKARQSALKQMVQTFFDGSTEQAVAALLSKSKLKQDELDRLSLLIEQARKEGR